NPSARPIAPATTTEPIATASETRAPNSTRVRMSRPRMSVPSRWVTPLRSVANGGNSLLAGDRVDGSPGQTSDSADVSSNTTTRTARPAVARRLRRKRDQSDVSRRGASVATETGADREIAMELIPGYA